MCCRPRPHLCCIIVGVGILTPLHRALGREAAPLDPSILREAIESNLAEAADLDWKKELPHAKNDEAGDEFAKDVAAMANSGGGWIVYGVEEDGQSRAKKLSPVQWRADDARRLRAFAYGRVYPPAVGVDFDVVDVDGGVVVAMHVPDSVEAPHFARYRQNGLRSPRRNGADTVFMSEHEIERAYAARFARRNAWRDDMQELFEATVRASARDSVVCGILVARPTEPVARRDRIDKSVAHAIFSNLDRKKSCPEAMATIHPGMSLPRPGLRSWLLEMRSPQGARLAIYADGSTGVSVELGSWTDKLDSAHTWPVGEPCHTIARAVEWFVDDGVALAAANVEAAGITSPLRLTASVVGPDSTPLVVRDEHLLFGREWRIDDVSQSRSLPGFEAVTASMTAHADEAERYDITKQLALDLLNQAGIEHLKSLGAPG